MSEFTVFDNKELEIQSSTLTADEFKLLFKKNKIIYLSIRDLSITDNQSTKLPKTESFGTILEILKDTKPKKMRFSFKYSAIPAEWLEMLHESRCKFLGIEIKMVEKEKILADSELLHKFISTQKKGFELSFSAYNVDPDESFDDKFSNYFKKIEERDRVNVGKKNLLIYKLFGLKLKEMYFEPVVFTNTN